ncbi:DNA-binding protein [Bradyrhizobium huanghuaihaiense]|uniref:DNA-binding protein n=1 Tax=Bradyrhizobium huanghuaihaiense TaxID=990078 RepID=UPI0021AAAA75|nr:DNA-binding protein [Bradyrhizobium sp. CB3035]UWU81015.1 DNA-binding protein [Bradyrhizobium sp. CB3035]
MRSIKQPGAPVAERIQWVEARGRAFSFTLQAGVPLLEAARRGFATEGFVGGVLNFRGGALGPFGYVMPALSKTGENAAFYSDTYRPQGITRTKLGSMTLGTRDGAPFFHCHGLWTEAGDKAGGGHMLPDETIVAEPFEVEAFGLDGAMFTAEPDPETNFKLFGPVALASTGARTTSRAFALRLRPNQDFAFCLEDFCRAHGIARAKIHGGVGSTIGARFTHGGVTEPFATELAITAGTIASGPSGELEAVLDVALIDYMGGIAEGRLIRGDNPVLMTMELMLEVLS